MNDQFLVLKKMKIFILGIDDILINYPRKEYVLKDQILRDSMSALEFIMKANMEDKKEKYQKEILVKLSMLDFYFEKSYKQKYISKKVFEHTMRELNDITKMIYGWIKYDRSKI